MENKHHSTKKWLIKRKLDVFFLYLEAIYAVILAYSLVLDYPLFVMEFKAGVIFTIFLMIPELLIKRKK